MNFTSVDKHIQDVLAFVQADRGAGYHRVQLPYRHLEGWFRKRTVEKVHSGLQALKDNIKELNESGFDLEDRTTVLKMVRLAIRCCALYVNSDTQEKFRSTTLYYVRKSLAGMDSGVKDGGITYRATRSGYARELFESLSLAMRIHRIRGYQPYDLFVRHRLERAWGLMQAIDARFRQISRIESLHRARLDSHKLVRHQALLSNLQRSAEFAFWVILAPYYIGHNVEALYIWEQGKEASEELAKFYGSFATVGTFVASLAWYVQGVVRRFFKEHRSE